MKSVMIILIDLVNYSEKNDVEQELFAKHLRKGIKKSIKDAKIQNPIIIPTGDGIFLGFIENGLEADFLKAIKFLFSLNTWAEPLDYKFRCAIHHGLCSIVKDVLNKKNLSGDTINNLSRIISAGKDDAIIIHDEAFSRFISGKQKTIQGYTFQQIDEGTVLDKHNFEHICHAVTIEFNGKIIGNTNGLKLTHLINVITPKTDKANRLITLQEEKLKSGTEIIFYGIYHPSTPKLLKDITNNGKREVTIKVLYAPDTITSDIQDFFTPDDNIEALKPSTKVQSINSIKDWVKTFDTSCKTKIKLYEYQNFPNFGATFVDMDIKRKGFIHISNYVRNIIPKETPYFESSFLTDNKPYLYDFYTAYFKDNILPNITEI